MSFENVYEDLDWKDIVEQYNELTASGFSPEKAIEVIEDRHTCLMTQEYRDKLQSNTN